MTDSVRSDIKAWLRCGSFDAAYLGLDPEQINEEAERLLAALVAGRPVALRQSDPPERKIEILHALAALATRFPETVPLKTIEAVYALTASTDVLNWVAHRDFLLSQLVLAGWRRCRATLEHPVHSKEDTAQRLRDPGWRDALRRCSAATSAR
jgi:hypothetical protein